MAQETAGAVDGGAVVGQAARDPGEQLEGFGPSFKGALETSCWVTQSPPGPWSRRSCTKPSSLSQLLGAYFHRDFSDIYASREEALDEYVSEAEPQDRVQAAQEIGELLGMVSSDQELRAATAG
ncbi:contact-dependent growth inhibition system immunity protein [Streptomyces sp. NPDC056405]|uniref:contact-dependent growth inhibition system immunity protein n=1 Tax=Streptomyces sp. NPDC056405 TaxID=3345811 RepID=UPI0035D711B4